MDKLLHIKEQIQELLQVIHLVVQDIINHEEDQPLVDLLMLLIVHLHMEELLEAKPQVINNLLPVQAIDQEDKVQDTDKQWE